MLGASYIWGQEGNEVYCGAVVDIPTMDGNAAPEVIPSTQNDHDGQEECVSTSISTELHPHMSYKNLTETFHRGVS